MVKIDSQHINSKDPTGGDHSFRQWFKRMWKIKAIQYFFVWFPLLVAEIIGFNTVLGWVGDAFADSIGTGIFTLPFILLPPAAVLILVYKDFYQDWKDYINGQSK